MCPAEGLGYQMLLSGPLFSWWPQWEQKPQIVGTPGLFPLRPCPSLSQVLGIDSLPSVLFAEATITKHLKLWLKVTDTCCLIVQEAGRPTSWIWQGLFLLSIAAENLCQASPPAAGGLVQSLGFLGF